MSILTTIHFQLSKIKDLMQKDFKDKKVTVNYFFCENECNFLDKVSLSEYLTEKKIENFTFLKSINTLCQNIIDLWNEDFKDLPNRMFDKTFHSKKIIFSDLEFHAIYLTETKWQFFNTLLGKVEFTENYEYLSFQIADIVQRCSLILNWITAAYPDTLPNGKDKNSRDKDIRYVLAHDFFDKIKDSHYFKSFSDQIKRNGFNPVDYNGNKLKVYTPELTYLLFVNDYKVFNTETQTDTQINGKEFLKAFYSGFLEGEQFFYDNYKVSTNILYDKANTYIPVIHDKYFHNGKNKGQGWDYVKYSYPLTITKKQIKEIGYFSGIVSKVDEMIEAHPDIIEKFDKCNHKKTEQSIETEKNYSIKQIVIAYCVLDKYITTENYFSILEKHSQSRSKKILQKRIYKISDLSKLAENKTTDTKHLKNLQEAKRLLSGIKNKKSVKDIKRIITAFLTSYDNYY